MGIAQLIPDAETLLALPPEELAFYVLRAAVDGQRNGAMRLESVFEPLRSRGHLGELKFFYEREDEVQIAITEAWMWLENQLLVVGTDTNGWRVLGRRARDLRSDEQFAAFRKAAAFPRDLLHPRIADRAWIALMRNEFDAAVFFSFRAVEEAVRAACGYPNEKVGVPLMRDAFHIEHGPLTNRQEPEAERQALRELFAGAMGSYKNPHSHRTVALTEAAEAQEIVMLASHLLRIVDSRAAAIKLESTHAQG